MPRSRKKLFNNVKELKEYIIKNNFKDVKTFCNHVLEHYTANTKIMNKLINKYKECNREDSDSNIYFNTYSSYMLLPELLKKCYDSKIFTPSKIDRALILEHGRNYPDGFSGIKVKRMSYTNDYIIEVVDGERAQLFIKTYRYLPTLDQLIYDSIFDTVLFNDGSKEYKPSIIELFE
jgi:N-acyl-D-aspartate/D-glutamate deacylase